MDAHTEFQQPSFSVWVEEGVCEVVPIILWDLKGFILDAVVQVLRVGGEIKVVKCYNMDYWVEYEHEYKQDIYWQSCFIEKKSRRAEIAFASQEPIFYEMGLS